MSVSDQRLTTHAEVTPRDLLNADLFSSAAARRLLVQDNPPLKCSSHSARTAGFSEDGRLLAWQPTPVVTVVQRLCDVEAGAKPVVLRKHVHQSPVTSVRFALAHAMNTIVSLDNEAKNKTGVHSPTEAKSISTRKIRKHMLATGHENGQIRLWEACTMTLATNLLSHTTTITDLRFGYKAPGKRLVLFSTSNDLTLKIWVLEHSGYNLTQTLNFSHPPLTCAWSDPLQRLAVAGVDPTVHVCYPVMSEDSSKLCRGHELKGHASHVVDMKFCPNEVRHLISASWDSKVLVWDAVSGERLRALYHTYPPPQFVFNNPIKSLVVKKSFVITVTEEDAQLRLWDTAWRQGKSDDLNEPVQCLQITSEEPQALALNPQGNVLAVCGNSTLTLCKFQNEMESLEDTCRNYLLSSIPGLLNPDMLEHMPKYVQGLVRAQVLR